jgi:hypothetical protein
MVFGDLGSTPYYYSTTRARGITKEAKSEAMIEGKAIVSPWIRRRVPKTETSQPGSSSDRLISHGCDCFTYFTNPLGKQITDTAVVPHQPRVRAECLVLPDTLGVTNVITAMKSGMCTDAII